MPLAPLWWHTAIQPQHEIWHCWPPYRLHPQQHTQPRWPEPTTVSPESGFWGKNSSYKHSGRHRKHVDTEEGGWFSAPWEERSFRSRLTHTEHWSETHILHLVSQLKEGQCLHLLPRWKKKGFGEEIFHISNMTQTSVWWLRLLIPPSDAYSGTGQKVLYSPTMADQENWRHRNGPA